MEYYFLHGVLFEKEEWERILSQKMTFAEILGFQNIEQRRVAASYAGDLDRLLREADAILIRRV